MDFAVVNWYVCQVIVYQMEKRIYLSCIFVLLTIVVWWWTNNLVKLGADGTVMLWAWMSTMFTGGSLIIAVIYLRKKRKDNYNH